MAGPGVSVGSSDNPRKIKGGRWTVFRFFLVSTAYTSVWLAVSSQLGSYREQFGPQVLLQLNIAYFLPSIPLLLVSGFFDKVLEAKLGVAKTVLIRLLVGLVGYGALCAWFPFMPQGRIWYLLNSVVALGLFSGIAFSASYQLVARFANKNVIALGLGCSASGPLVLLLQLAVGMGEEPTKLQEILLYETIAVIVLAGLWATVSLLVRHWDAIEGFDQRQQQEEQQQLALQEPLLSPRGPGEGLPGSPPAPGAAPIRHGSLPPLISFLPLEPYESFITADEELPEGQAPLQHSSSWSAGSVLGGASDDPLQPAAAADVERSNSDPAALPSFTAAAAAGLPPLPPHHHALPPPPPGQQHVGQDGRLHAQQQGGQDGDTAAAAAAAEAALAVGQEAGALSPPHRVTAGLQRRVSFSSVASNLETGSPHYKPETPHASEHGQQQEDMGRLALAALRQIWAALSALLLSGTISLIIFPFFTYVPTSGLLGEALPKTLFFARIFADILGRFLPRLRCLAVDNGLAVLFAALCKLACVPIFFVYLKSPDRFHSDALAVIFIIIVWTLGGYINTMANVLAPRLVQPHLKPTAAGLMAITYQTAHFLGLVIATVAALLLYGDIGVE